MMTYLTSSFHNTAPDSTQPAKDYKDQLISQVQLPDASLTQPVPSILTLRALPKTSENTLHWANWPICSFIPKQFPPNTKPLARVAPTNTINQFLLPFLLNFNLVNLVKFTKFKPQIWMWWCTPIIHHLGKRRLMPDRAT